MKSEKPSSPADTCYPLLRGLELERSPDPSLSNRCVISKINQTANRSAPARCLSGRRDRRGAGPCFPTGIVFVFVALRSCQLAVAPSFPSRVATSVFSWVSPALTARMSYSEPDVVETLDRVADTYGRPKRVRRDNGSEFVSKDLDLWTWAHGAILDFNRPGKLWAMRLLSRSTAVSEKNA